MARRAPPAPPAPRRPLPVTPSASEAFLPPSRELDDLRVAAAGCTACDLYRKATQTVFGAGPAGARVMLVGEQPGDKEDLAGAPFVGPAGGLLDASLAAVGIDRGQVYVTNAVKHFYYEERGKARIHKKPEARHLRACRGWLEAEIEAVRPRVVVALGATAAQDFMGPSFKVTQRRGEVLSLPQGPAFVATLHPAAILRMPDREARREAEAAFVADLAVVAALVEERRHA